MKFRPTCQGPLCYKETKREYKALLGQSRAEETKDVSEGVSSSEQSEEYSPRPRYQSTSQSTKIALKSDKDLYHMYDIVTTPKSKIKVNASSQSQHVEIKQEPIGIKSNITTLLLRAEKIT